MVDELLIKRQEELNILVSDIEKSVAWQVAIKDLQDKIDTLDSSWHLVSKDKFLELQVAKLSIMEIMNIVEDWKDELEQVTKEIEDQQNGVQTTDFDNE